MNAGTLAGGQLDGLLEVLGKLRRQVVRLPARQSLGERVQRRADRLLGPVLIDARTFAHLLHELAVPHAASQSCSWSTTGCRTWTAGRKPPSGSRTKTPWTDISPEGTSICDLFD